MRLKLFLAMCVFGGVGGFVGSLVGAMFGSRGLFIGGFVAAALVAINTLSSPVGPILSNALTGIGALIGSRYSRPKPASPLR
jgi:hypothetical protein